MEVQIFLIVLSLLSLSPTHTRYDLCCFQEHTFIFIIKLLSPPVPADYSGSDSHLISHAPLFNALLVGISSVDSVQMFSLHGLVGRIQKLYTN